MSKKKNQHYKPIPNDAENASVIVKRVLSENFHHYKFTYLAAIGCMFMIAGATAAMAYIIKDVVNDVFEAKQLSSAYLLAGAILVIFFTRGMAAFGQHVLLNRVGNNIVARYQKRVFDHMLKLGVGFYADTRSAYLVGQINQNLSGVRKLLNQLITVFARDLLTFIGLLSVMIYMDPLMAFGSLFVMPIAGFVLSRYVKRIKKLSREEIDVNSRVMSSMVETAQGIPVVKAFTMESQMADKLGGLVNNAESRANSIALVNASTKPLTETLAGLAIAGSIAFGGWRVIALDGDNGALLAFLTAAMLAYDPARRLASFRVEFEKSLVNARMVYELLDTPPRQTDRANAKDFKPTNGEIEFKDVCFAYENGEQVLNKVSIKAAKGKTTALVGPSGGGKTTLINLVLRFYDLTSGSIKVDGQDIQNLKAASLRANMALVSQHPVLFEGTIAENLRYARPNATDAEIVEAAKLAQAHDFILETPQGYETPIGEMGSNLSGGQRQRISIARALLRDAKILLLDEATSALDNKSEKLVQNALDQLMKGRTTIVVAHRLSTIQNADKIVVIDSGRVVEQGTHKSLMSAKNGKTGMYSKLQKISSSAPKKTNAAKKRTTKKPTTKTAK
ncbi:MAG: ABC transporter ATP-binding protein [Nitratireductor sp.]